MFDEIAWLERAGHEIAHFSTLHPENQASPWSEYFVPYLELGEETNLTLAEKTLAASRLFHNREAVRQFTRLIADFHPHIIHVHGIHRQISPAILDVARKSSIPVAQSLHDFHLICPANTLLYRNMALCSPRRCGNLWFGPCVRGRCVRGSFVTSALSATETAWAHVRRSYQRGVKRFICPSEFTSMQMQLAGWKVPSDVVPNGIAPEPPSELVGDDFAVIGRLSREKGIDIALEAARSARAKLTVAGDGPLRSRLQSDYPEATFAGYLNGQQVRDLIRRSRAIVVPSLCFENAPMSILEAMAAGVPVIASRIGGIPEQVTDGVDGLLVEPGDAVGFSLAMKRLVDDPALADRLGVEARQTVARRFSPEAHLSSLVKTYEACLRS